MNHFTRSTLTVLLLAVTTALAQAQQYPSGSAQPGQTGSTSDQVQTQPMGQTGQWTPGQLPQGFSAKDLGNAKAEVRDTFDGLVKAALNRDNFQDLTDHLAKSDRERLAVNDEKYNDRLNGAIDQFRQAWKTKYNNDFTFNADQSFSDQYLNVTTGEVSDPAQVSHWPLPPMGKMTQETAKPSMNQGTEIAIASFTGQGGKPFNVSLVREGTDWKIDIPDKFNNDQLQENLAKHITELTNMQGQWGDDQSQAHRFIVTHVLYGLYGVEKSQTGASESPSTSSGMQEGKHKHQGTESHEGSQLPSSSMDESESDIQD